MKKLFSFLAVVSFFTGCSWNDAPPPLHSSIQLNQSAKTTDLVDLRGNPLNTNFVASALGTNQIQGVGAGGTLGSGLGGSSAGLSSGGANTPASSVSGSRTGSSTSTGVGTASGSGSTPSGVGTGSGSLNSSSTLNPSSATAINPATTTSGSIVSPTSRP